MSRHGKVITVVLALILANASPRAGAKDLLESSTACRPCHPKIYEQWSASRHASSFVDPLFRMSLEKVQKEDPSSAEKCVVCHGPTATIPSGGGEKLVREGVTCDFCHTIKEIGRSGELPTFVNTPGTKRGPVDQADSSHHDTAFSSLHLHAELCGSCHEYTNLHGLKILSTYSEWEGSFYKGEEIHCQYCHLPELYGDTQFRKNDSTTGKPDHMMKGGHFASQLHESLRTEGEISYSGKNAIVTLYLTNVKSGHAIPTGIPTHRVVISVVVFNERGNVVGRGEAYVEKVLGDGTGNPIENPADMFLKAKEVLKDNRVMPKKTEKISLTIPTKGMFESLNGSISLFYELPSPDPSLKKVRIKFADIILQKRRLNRTVLSILFVLLAITILLVAYDIVLRVKKKG